MTIEKEAKAFKLLEVEESDGGQEDKRAKALAVALETKDKPIAEMDHIKSLIAIHPLAKGDMPQLENKNLYSLVQRMASPKKGQKAPQLLNGKTVKQLVEDQKHNQRRFMNEKYKLDKKWKVTANMQGGGSLVDPKEYGIRETFQ